jgi:hypothetical protein
VTAKQLEKAKKKLLSDIPRSDVLQRTKIETYFAGLNVDEIEKQADALRIRRQTLLTDFINRQNAIQTAISAWPFNQADACRWPGPALSRGQASSRMLRR